MFVYEILKLRYTEYIGSGREDNILPELLGTGCRCIKELEIKVGLINEFPLLLLIAFSQTHLPFPAQHLTVLIFH